MSFARIAFRQVMFVKTVFDCHDYMESTKGAVLTDLRFIEQFHRTPYICQMQHPVWPICCGDFTEYIGEAPIAGTEYSDYECWLPQDWLVERFKLADFYPLSKISAVLHSMALFRCHQCEKKYWDFQYSGLFWKGPLEDSAEGTR